MPRSRPRPRLPFATARARDLRRLLIRAVALATLAVAPSALADPAAPIGSFSPFDLAAEGIVLPEPLATSALTMSGARVTRTSGAQALPCTVDVADGMLMSAGPGTCPMIWEMAAPVPLDLVLGAPDAGLEDFVALALRPRTVDSPTRLSLDDAGGAIVVPGSFPEGVTDVALRVFDASGRATWQTRPVEAGRIGVDAPTIAAIQRAGGTYAVYGTEDGGEVWAWRVAASSPTPVRPTPVPPSPVATVTAAPLGAEGVELPPELQCPPPTLPNEDMIVVCVDATGPSITYRMSPSGVRNVKPNRYFYVRVLHRADHKVTVDLGGQVGSYVPGSRGRLGVGPGGFNLGGEEAVELVATTRTFAPRRPGFAPLTVRSFDLANQPVVDPLVVEFWVSETFSGAFRVGLAGVFFGGVDQQFSTVTREGSGQSEIIATDGNVMDLDLVIGYSPYLDSGGRPDVGCEHAPFCFNPYFGIGLLSTGGDGELSWLKSVHLGVEWELTDAFAIGITANLRRAERLAEGFRVGQPLDGDVPTEERFVVGMGVVVNLSPSFFKIGAGGADALTQ